LPQLYLPSFLDKVNCENYTFFFSFKNFEFFAFYNYGFLVLNYIMKHHFIRKLILNNEEGLRLANNFLIENWPGLLLVLGLFLTWQFCLALALVFVYVIVERSLDTLINITRNDQNNLKFGRFWGTLTSRITIFKNPNLKNIEKILFHC